jgi:hypothetical protein
MQAFFIYLCSIYDVVSRNLSRQSRRTCRPLQLAETPNYINHVYISHSIGVS